MIPSFSSYSSPEDIANRALEIVGQETTVTSILTDTSKKGRLLKKNYPQLLQAELERNVWTFATRRSVIRPIDSNSMIWTPAAWSGATTYAVGAVVSYDDGYGSRLWQSTIPGNINNTPGASSTQWTNYFGQTVATLFATSTSYFSGDLVYKTQTDGTFKVYLSLQTSNSDDPATTDAWDTTITYPKGAIVSYLSTNYVSNVDGNVGLEPDTHATQWTVTASTGSFKWLQVGTTLAALQVLYPLNTGPTDQSETRNVYPLPYGYRRKCSQDPKAGSASFLGAPSNRQYDDWIIENGFICSREVDPIILRYVAHVTSVSAMSGMFCEGLAARIAIAVAEPLTQDVEKRKLAIGEYEKFMKEARLINAIENDAEEAALDDWIATRI